MQRSAVRKRTHALPPPAHKGSHRADNFKSQPSLPSTQTPSPQLKHAQPIFFLQSWVEEEQVKNIKTYTNPENAGGTVPYLPFLIAVVVGMLGTTVAVVAQTSS